MSCDISYNREELHSSYGCLFPNGNRNSASHRWSHHILHHAPYLTKAQIDEQFQAFCPVSGSPIPHPNLWNETLPTTKGGVVQGDVNYCCWPCSCDLRDASKTSLRIHETSISTKEGPMETRFIVMDDPCKRPESIPKEAPDVTCVNGKLDFATHIDTPMGEKVIIGMLSNTSLGKVVEKERCDLRKEDGFESGMGTIFRRLTGLNS
jgi:hypothetical protein